MKSQESSSTIYDRTKKGIGIAFAGALKAAEATMKGATAVLAVQAGLGLDGANALSTSDASGTALAHRDGGNATALRPGLDQRLPHLSNQTDLERHLRKVTPELLEHLGKFVKNPEQFIQNIQNREQRQKMRRLAEKAQEHPEVLESVRKLFEETPGKESSEINLRKFGKGTERLTPDQINPEVWRSVRKMLTEKMPTSDQQNNVARRELNDNTGTPVVLVHGFVASIGDPVNCGGGYWGDAINYLKAQGYSDVRAVQYYTSSSNCDVDLHNPAYQDRCDGFNPGSEGTNNEDLNHVSCLLVQYLNQNFAGQNVILVGHSMGGIIIRNAMRLVQENGGQFGFPADIGYVTDTVTFNSPHAGVSVGESLIGCLDCTQANQLTAGSDFMNNLAQNAQNPQTSAGFTQWTVVGSECDPLVGALGNPDGAANAVAMQASHAIMYTKDNSVTCYNHGSALHDSSAANDATLYSCDTTPNVPCGTDYQNQAATVTNWVKTTTGSRGLQTLYKAVQQ